MVNSVTFRAPRCSVSDRFQMRPRISLGSLAFSKISFAFSPRYSQQSYTSNQAVEHPPESTPLMAPDFSNRPAYSAALTGVNGGTRMGPWPLI